MDKLKYSLFDLFVYMVPGAFVLFSIYLSYHGHIGFQVIKNIMLELKDVNIFISVLFVVIAYCVGFITSTIGKYYLRLKELIFPIKVNLVIAMSNSEKYSLIREKSKENFKYIEQWNVLKNFSANLACCVLLVSGILYAYVDNFTLPALLIGIAVSILLLIQSTKFNIWAMKDLDNAVRVC